MHLNRRDCIEKDTVKPKPSRRRNKDVAASLKLTSLVEDTGSSIRHHTLDHRTLSELPRLVVDLDCQFPDKKAL